VCLASCAALSFAVATKAMGQTHRGRIQKP
jgi:hypothetical protein